MTERPTTDAHVRAMLEAIGHPGRAGVYHGTDDAGNLVIDGQFAKQLLAELLDLRALGRSISDALNTGNGSYRP